MFTRQCIFTTIAIYCFMLGSILAAGVILQDGMEGVRINEVFVYNTDENTTYTMDDSTASPFTSPTFGTSTVCGKLDDQSTVLSPYLSPRVLLPGVGTDDWVRLQFDFSPVSGNCWQWQFILGDTVAYPNAFHLRNQGTYFAVMGRYNTGESISLITVPNITIQEGDWYHVDVMLRPSSYNQAQRTYTVTITRDSSGVRTTGSLTGVLQEDDSPINYFAIKNIVYSNHTHTPCIRVDNVLVEALTPETYMSDGMEGTPLNPLTAFSTDGNATYSTTENNPSPFTSEPEFTSASTVSGLLDDQSTAVTPYLRSIGLADSELSSLEYAHLQFDVRFVSGDFDQWQYYLGEDDSSPYAFRAQINGSNLVVYGRYDTGDSLQLISIPNVTAVEGDWYHVDVVMKPIGMEADQRSYDITVAQNSSGTITKGSLFGILQEDDEALDVFYIRHITDAITTRTGAIQIDNVLVQTMGFGDPAAGENVDFRYAYLPSFNKLRYYIGSSSTSINQYELELIRDSDQSVLTTDSSTFPFPASGKTITIPALADGDYTVKLTLTAANGILTQAIERYFTHTDPPWKNSSLGNDDVLVPPFTALEVDGNNVSCILRNHTMSSAGLWSQVQSQSTNLLDEAITFKVVSNGQTYTASGSGVNFNTTTDTKVTGSATWSAGPITDAGVDFEYDYDGLMKVTLNLPTTESQVDELYLEIPLEEAEASYMQAVTDHMRRNQAKSIPTGTGEVWNSSDVSRYQLPAPFVSYIWLGGPERGICWLAENDKDCLLDADVPMMQISRSSGRVTLKIWFITKPGVLSRTRTIQFALMATPAKPMPELPKSWRQWWPFETASQYNDLNFALMGSDYYWGSQTPCLQFYPAFHNYEIYDEFFKSRQSGIRDQDFIDAWIAQFTDPIYDPYDEEVYRPHINWSFNLFTTTAAGWFLGGRVREEVAKDGLEGATINPLASGSTDENATWTTTADNPSPFDTNVFGTSTLSGLLNDQSTEVTPYVGTSGFELSSTDWVWAQFDICPVSGDYWQWGMCLGDTASVPYAMELRFNAGGFAIRGRRALSESLALIQVPNITITTGNWYRIDVILSPSEVAAANRTYTLTVTEDDGEGNRTYGTVRGILQEDSNPTNWFRMWNFWLGSNHTRFGTIQIDNFLVRNVKPSFVAPYTNPRGMVWDDEAMTYMDEWSIYDVADPRWQDAVTNGVRLLRQNAASYDALTGSAYQYDPISSYQNMALYYQKKMYDSFCDGIYWDDFFTLINYNPVSGPGYVGDDGRLRPGVNLYGFRQLAKRHAIMQHQMHMRPFAWIHMTSNQIVPILSFGQVNYDWEWVGFTEGASYDMDAQDRFDLDNDPVYMLATTCGFQSGNLGVIRFNPVTQVPEEREWLLRTTLAVALTHEAKIKTYHSLLQNTAGRLITFGYGMSDCTVYRYWDSVYPITFGGTAENIKALVLKRSGKAYVILGSYGDGGDCDFTLDLTELGLSSAVNATDDETSTSLTKLGTGQFSIYIDKHDFKLIKIE